MSRFIDKLKRLRQAEPQPMGFATSRVTPEKPKLQLVARLAAENLDKISDALTQADAALIEVGQSEDLAAVEKMCRAEKGIPTGVWLRVSAAEIVNKLTEISCDFVLFPTSFPLAVTEKEKTGRILELDSDMSDSLLRTVNDLPVDAVMLSIKSEDTPLTLNRLMQIRRPSYMVNKPILISVPDSLSVNELQALWDMGISGVIIQSINQESAEKFAELRKRIDKLSPPNLHKKDKMSAILPRMTPETTEPRREGEEEEEEDE